VLDEAFELPQRGRRVGARDRERRIGAALTPDRAARNDYRVPRPIGLMSTIATFLPSSVLLLSNAISRSGAARRDVGVSMNPGGPVDDRLRQRLPTTTVRCCFAKQSCAVPFGS
jgi:hypothetical protein